MQYEFTFEPAHAEPAPAQRARAKASSNTQQAAYAAQQLTLDFERSPFPRATRRGEIWKPCPSYPGTYASSQGRIVAPLPTKTGLHLRRPHKHTDGYIAVSINNKLTKRAHLVADAFHGPRPRGLIVRHLDSSRDNDRPQNLQWGTRAENAQDMVRAGRQSRQKLDDADVYDILTSTDRNADAAQRHGVHRETIAKIRRGRRWAHLAPYIPRRTPRALRAAAPKEQPE